MTYDYSGLDDVSKKFFQNVKANGDVPEFLNDGSKIIVTADSKEKMDQLKATVTMSVDGKIFSSNSNDNDDDSDDKENKDLAIAPAGLIGLKILGFEVPDGVVNSQEDLIFIPKQVRLVGQERFAGLSARINNPAYSRWRRWRRRWRWWRQ